MYVPEVHDLPSTHRTVVPYTAARNPYASACVAHMPQQKVPKHQNIAFAGEFVSMHRWNTSPSVPDTNSVYNLTDDIDFDALFLLAVSWSHFPTPPSQPHLLIYT
eukprot:151133-Ditylum_brightwellii.AAC.1